MTRLQSKKRMAGVTLMELLTVVLIVAVLAAIAVPTYQSQMRHSRRTDAKNGLMDLAAREEKYFSLNNTYTNSPANLGYVASTSTAAFPLTIGSGYYQVYVCLNTATPTASTSTSSFCAAANATATGNEYVVAAAPLSTSPQNADSDCQYFAVDQTGQQYSSSTAGGGGTNNASTCWQ